MNPNPLLGQGRRRIDIISHVTMFLLCNQSHEVNLMYWSLHCDWWYQATQRGMRGGGWVRVWPETQRYKF